MRSWFKEKVPTDQDNLNDLIKDREGIVLRMLELQHTLNLTDDKIKHYEDKIATHLPTNGIVSSTETVANEAQ